MAIALGAIVLAVPATAQGHVAHTVEPGETLWSIAAASNLTTRALAAANGLSPDAAVVIGSTIYVPSEAEAARALTGGAPADPDDGPGALGAYTVQAGETLSGIAARSGIPTGQLAWMNGLDPDQPLIAGSALKLPTGGTATPSAPPSAAARPASGAAPQPTNEHVDPSTVSSIAGDHGVPGSLAAAIARQESGFSNAVVSPANARGVMQILPGTWDFVQDNLASGQLDPASARENVHGGVMYLGQLLRDTGGDEAMATAAYYQGLSSVRRIGMLPETQRYVANVMAQRQMFGGP